MPAGVLFYGRCDLRAIIVPILQDFSPNDVHHIINNHSESVFLFVSDRISGYTGRGMIEDVRGSSFSLSDFRYSVSKRW